jgi:glycosyltransferase involved in cell wall biosynthesis
MGYHRGRQLKTSLAARAKDSQALRRVIMPLVVRFPTLLRRLMTLGRRFARDVAHPDWPGPLPAEYLRLPLASRKVLLDLARAAGDPARPVNRPLPARERLAWVTPYLPDAVQAVLLGQLAQRYDIDLVVPDGTDGAAMDAGLPLRSGAWFEQHHAQFARVLYHVGNSAAHAPLLRLLTRHPGIVFLHDFSLAAAVAHMAAGNLTQALYHAHGYSGLAAWRDLGAAATLAAVPLNRIVFDHADGIIVDPADACAMRSLAQAWYGPCSTADLRLAGECADEYATAIEDILTTSAPARYRQSLRNLAASGIPADPRERALIDAAKVLAASQPARAPRQLLVDISSLMLGDVKTGIPRVVRSILLALLKEPPAGFRVEPVYGSGIDRRYRYARRFTLSLMGFDDVAANDDPVGYQREDIFLGLDSAPYTTLNNLDTLDDMRTRGIAVYFVIYDILPLLQADAFYPGSPAYFSQYILGIARHADGVACISRAVADELGDWLDIHGGPRSAPFKIGQFHLGANLDASAPSSGMPADAGHILASMAARPSLLMVGTIEPRKAHAQALAAFELLWQKGIDVNLVIVGKQGWMVDAVATALRGHPQLGKKLFWLHGVSDQMLTEAYRLAAALLAASLGEGFGLPLIEAAQHGLPIIARGLPVFREVSGEHAFYFEGTEPAQLADAIKQWLDLYRQGMAPASSAMPWLTWSESAHQLLDTIVHQRWYRTVA